MTVLLAILLALGVPFAQIQTPTQRITCCCPDPDSCKCPDHKRDHSGQSKMNTCHRQAENIVRAELADFVAPAAIEIVIPLQPTVDVGHVLPAPHAPPSLRRPDAPS